MESLFVRLAERGLLQSKLNWIIGAQGKVVSNIPVDLSWEMKHITAAKQSLSGEERKYYPYSMLEETESLGNSCVVLF